jgi:two-component system cell cycle sensor histidine kinase/response regulator CckA
VSESEARRTIEELQRALAEERERTRALEGQLAAERLPTPGAMSERQIDDILASSPVFISVYDLQGICTHCHGPAAMATEVVGKPALERHAGSFFITDRGEAMNGRTVLQRVLAGESLAGTSTLAGRHYHSWLSPLREGGALVGVVAVSTDVTLHEESQEARRQAEERLHALISSAPMLVFATDAAGNLTLGEGRGWEMAGMDAASLVGRPVREVLDQGRLVQGEEAITADQAFERLVSGATLTLVGELGGRLFELWLTPARSGDGQSVIGVGVDITRRQGAERALRDATDMFEALIEASPVAILTLDREGQVRLWNPAAERLLGWPVSEVLGRRLPVSREDEPGLLASLAAGQSFTGALVRRPTRDLRMIDVLLSRAPLRNPAGQIVGAVEILVDVSEQRRLEEQLVQAQKMEAVGRLAGGIAHDFNNVLAVIQGFVWITHSDLPAADPMREDLDQVLRAVDRASGLTRQLLAFSRKQVFRMQILDVNALVVEVRKMLARVIGEDIELQTRLGPDAGRVRADAGQMEQVLLNLAVNARDAMPRGGVLTVETAHVSLDEESAQQRLELKPGAYVMIAVSDTGIGMDRATLDHIFEPFFTTKEKGRGTGLGLSTAYGIVKQSGGDLTVESRPGAGSTFRIYLPRTQAQRTDVTVRIERPNILHGSETVLVVEDEEMVRQLASQVLRRSGYVVLEAANAGEALLIGERHEGTIHLLLSDVVMPRVSGVDLARRLKQQRPAIKVLFMSGYTEEAMAQHGLLDVNFGLLEKPFTPQALLTEVRETLEHR